MNRTSVAKLLDLAGKVAIVTGGAAGIGFGISSRLAEAGALVVVANRSAEDSAKATAELTENGWKATAIHCDVSDESSVKNLVEKTVETYGRIDILVNNAGIFPSIPVTKMELSDFENVIKTNVYGVFLATKYVTVQMIKQGEGGKVINVTSIDALHPSMVGLAHYDTSKHGVWGFTKNVALELAPYKIWVNAIAPGGIATPGVAKLSPKGVDMSNVMEMFLAKIPMHRMGEIDDIGKVALFLASDMSSYMTGTQVVVDGGVLLS